MDRTLMQCLLALAACLVLPERTMAQQMTELVAKEKAKAAIVLPADPAGDEVLAAREIADHLRRMSGTALPVLTGQAPDARLIPIRIGLSFAPDVATAIKAGGDEPGSFLLRVTPDEVLLAGLSPRGTLFAAYELLEQLGIHWFFPGELGTVVPERPTVALPVGELIQHPAFSGRRLQDLLSDSEKQWARRMRAGGMDGGAHGLGISADPKTEPELFMHNGTGKLKVSHPEIQRRVIAHWRQYLEANPDAKYLPIGPADGAGFGNDPWDAGDMDPLHAKISVTDRYVKFFNIVLGELQKDYPDVGIGFYAYAQYMRPPVREKPNPRILPVFAPIDICRFHAIDNPVCPERAYIKDIVEGWQALGVKLMYRGYLLNLADQGLPFSMIRQVAAEYPYYKEQGFLACRVECKPAWSYHAPSLYLAYRIMWDTGLDVDAVMAEYFEQLYGPAGGPMQAHFDRLERAYAEADYHTGNVFDIPYILTDDIMAELRETLEKAEKAAGEDIMIARRVAMVRAGFNFGVATLEMMAAVNGFDFVTAKERYDQIMNEMVPAALEHDPQLLNFRYAGRFTERFWGGTVASGYESVTGGNEIAVKLPDEWQFLLDPLDGGEALGFYRPGMGDRNWTTIRTASTSWSNQGLRYYKGGCWYRTQVAVPAAYRGRELRLWLGGVDDQAKAWINGTELPLLSAGAAPIGRPWEFDATETLKVDAVNIIVVKVSNRNVDELGTGGLTGPAMIRALK